MRNSVVVVVVVVAMSLLRSACAGIDFHSINDDKADDGDTGFRYYETSPFLLVCSDGKGGLESELLYLPDTTKKRSIKPSNFGAQKRRDAQV